jgi:DNA-binding SARP family transcriptional activator/ABC-type branched-subunit amino acid transport system substrate-binding protein/DNA-binding beta-propeller fold protein YncE
VLEFRILGPLEVVEHDQLLALGGPKQRALLAILLLHRGEVVSTDRLSDELWGERPPASAAKTVQAYVSNLRRALGDGLLVTRGHGYLLRTARGQLDVDRFEALVDAGRTAFADGDAGRSSERLREALALWRGPPLADFAYEPFAQAEAARLGEERLAALEDRIDADLALGRHATLVGELEALVHEHPLRERLQSQLMLALYRSGRQADALERYQQARRKLLDELGIEPGRELQELELAILNQDPELGGPSRRLPRPPPSRRGALLLALGGLILAGAAVAAVLSLGGGTSSEPLLPAVDRVGIIDPRTGAVLTSVSVAGAPARLATDGREVWVAGDTSQTLQRIDPASPGRVAPVNGFPSDLAMGEGALWMVDALHGTLVKVNPAYGTVVARTPLTGAAREVAISDRAAFDPWSVAAGAGGVWVSDGSPRVYRIDPQTARIVRALNLGTAIDGLAADGNAVWAISGDAATVLRLDPSTGRVTARISIVSRPGLESPYPIGIAAGAGFVWVLNANSGTVTKIDPIARGIATTIPIGVDRGPLRLAAGAGAAWVADGDGTLSRTDASSDAVTYFPIAHGLTDVAVAGGRVWVTAGPGPGPRAGAGAQVSGPAVTSVRALPSSSCAPVLSQAGQPPRYLIASDMPLQGTGSELPLEMTDAIRFILQRDHFRAGRFTLGYQACDNSIVTPRGPPEENARCAPNARAFADDPSVIAVIGPFFSECASIEIPIANRATHGPLAMIAPAATAVGLTHAGPGAARGEPGRYYPTGQRNFARVIPADNVQGAADAILARAIGADRLFVLDDDSLYGSGVAASFHSAATRLGLHVVGASHWQYPARSYRSLVRRVQRSGATGVFLGGYLEDGSALFKALRDSLPTEVRMLTPDGFNGSDLVAELGSSAEGMTLSLPGRPISALPPAGRKFVSEFGASLTVPAQTDTAYAAQATQLMLDAIARSNGTRASVTHQLLTAKVTNEILGNFAITPNGDTTADAITIYQARNGRLQFLKVITPATDLLAP